MNIKQELINQRCVVFGVVQSDIKRRSEDVKHTSTASDTKHADVKDATQPFARLFTTEYKALFTILKAQPFDKDSARRVTDQRGIKYFAHRTGDICRNLYVIIDGTYYDLTIPQGYIAERGRIWHSLIFTTKAKTNYTIRSDVFYQLVKTSKNTNLAQLMKKIIALATKIAEAKTQWEWFISGKTQAMPDSIWNMASNDYVKQTRNAINYFDGNRYETPIMRCCAMNYSWLYIHNHAVTLDADEQGYFFRLGAISDEDLDIGLDRNDIPYVVWKARKHRIPRLSQWHFVRAIADIYECYPEYEGAINDVLAVASKELFIAEDFVDGYCGDRCAVDLKINVQAAINELVIPDEIVREEI